MLNNKTKKQNRRNESSSPSNKKTKKGIKRSFTIAKMESNGNTIIPEYKILDGPAFAKVNFKLDKGDTIYANAGAMSYMDKSVAIKTETRGFFKGLVRGLFTSQSMFLTGYTGTKSNTQISFASHLSGDIMPMIIKPGEKYTLSSRSVICMTKNIKLNTITKWRGMFAGENVFLTEAEVDVDSNTFGMIWIASYGGSEKLDIKSGQIMSIDNGMFLASPSYVNYTLGTVGGVKSFFFSGEGFVMDFTGPCSVYVQGRNYNEFIRTIRRYSAAGSNRGSSNSGFQIKI
jgi:uncharacterized protein (TIGR00266 family)